MKISITGASHFVNRMFEACGPFQWAREFLKNSREAGATQVEFGIEWQAVEKAGFYRRTIADNGSGMDGDELLKFFSTLGAGAKKMGGVHDNFGVGAKIATLPWNPEGVVVISYKAGRGSMIWMVLDDETQEYHLAEFETGSVKEVVIEPSATTEGIGIDWSLVAPSWARENGTVVVLLGSKEYPDTILGNPHAGESDIKGLSVYLNTRFWDLKDCDVKVVEPRNTKKTLWPQGPDDKSDTTRPNNRKVEGAKYYLTDPESKWTANGKPAHMGVVALDQARVPVEWYLWEGERPAVHSYAKKLGYLAVRYKGELYEVTAHKSQFRAFGIVESKVQSNLTIVIEPPLYLASNGRWGIYPDQSRNRLLFTGKGEKGIALPMADWGVEFADSMPDPILEAIRSARGGATGSIQDEDYRKRLQEKFGNRWTTSVRVISTRGKRGVAPTLGTATGEETDVNVETNSGPTDAPEPPDGEPQLDPPAPDTVKTRTTKTVRRRVATSEGTELTTERVAPVDLPRYRMANKENFDSPLHLAVWAPTDPDGPYVLINVDSPILAEIVAYHQGQYPDVHAEEIANTVRHVYGEVAVAKIAHSQKLARYIPKEELDKEYRSEKALTVALMGLVAEDNMIATRLGKLGAKRKVS